MPRPEHPHFVSPQQALAGLGDPYVTIEAKREYLKTLMDKLTEEGVEKLWPVLLWWTADPFYREAIQFPVLTKSLLDFLG